MVQASTEIQEQKIECLEDFSQKIEEFTAEVVRIDEEAAAVINQNKEDFYNKYHYLKPDAEKNFLEMCFDNAAEWCKEHWQEIVATIGIVIGAALAIAAVVTTGGAALVPLLAAVGATAGTAANISLAVAVIAVVSTIGAAALNIADTWGNIDNPIFNTLQTVFNWTSTIFNGLYSIGNMYNAVKGVSPKEYIARKKAIENGKKGYSNLEAKHPKMKHKSGGKYDGARKSEILKENMKRNNGTLRSDRTGKILEKPQRSVKGVKHPANEAQVDHIFPKAKGGMNSFSNAQVIERSANCAKGDSTIFSDYMKYSVPDVGSWSKAVHWGFYGNMNGIVNVSLVYHGR